MPKAKRSQSSDSEMQLPVRGLKAETTFSTGRAGDDLLASKYRIPSLTDCSDCSSRCQGQGGCRSWFSGCFDLFKCGQGMDAAVILMRIAFVQSIFNVANFFCLLESTGQSIVTPDYTEEGAKRMFRVDFGDSFQGITTTLLMMVYSFLSYYWLIRTRSESGISHLKSSSYLLSLMQLQMTVVYGNVYTHIYYTGEYGVPGEFCSEDGSRTDAAHCQLEVVGSCRLYRARYTENTALSSFVLGVVVFSSLQFVLQIVQSVLLFRWGPQVIAYTAEGSPLLSGSDIKHYT
eukprot:m.84838 g.84838  ORF g.84838 m.84838 type:complete len:289 (-) comp25812_c0_seq1:84-950(-)